MTVPTISTSAEVLATLEVGAGANTNAISRVVGATPSSGQTLVTLARYDCRDDDGSADAPRWYIEFSAANSSPAELHPSEIPALIDVLTEIRQAWIQLDPECFS
ncbi:hypothetical protein [Rhodococcus sp. UFZ-B548]|uniref:hypothetical protein n=1 Tax=Rhodococcus sp. UFZ-B548 TaxID=2742212 RepID=UPI0015F59F4D|nr:hypothetical protein [Rhodococcus sp. UFZ-B548]